MFLFFVFVLVFSYRSVDKRKDFSIILCNFFMKEQHTRNISNKGKETGSFVFVM